MDFPPVGPEEVQEVSDFFEKAPQLSAVPGLLRVWSAVWRCLVSSFRVSGAFRYSPGLFLGFQVLGMRLRCALLGISLSMWRVGLAVFFVGILFYG